MKKIFTCLGFAFIPALVSAQSIEITMPGETDDISGTVVELNEGAASMHQDFDVNNVSGGTLTLRIRRVKVTELAGTMDYLCWGADMISGTCYSAAVVSPENPWTTPDPAPIEDGASGWLSTYHETEGNAGCAQYRYYVIDESDEILDSIDVLYCSTVSIEEDSKVEVSIYPNPASQVLNVQLDNNLSNVGFTLYNVLGDEVLSTNLTTGNNTLNVSNLPNGVYFYSVLRKGNVLETKKLVIRH